MHAIRHPMVMNKPSQKRYGIARVLSKQGLASRTQAAIWVQEGRVRVNGRIVRNPEAPFLQGVDVFTLNDAASPTQDFRYVMLNKPRGLITTTKDEKARDTVYRCFDGANLPWLAPVGRLDKASEGLLLFSNDPVWAAKITSPESSLEKAYHVQINRLPSPADLQAMKNGIVIDTQLHAIKRVSVLRHGEKNAWLEIVLDEGKNRQIRKILSALHFDVLRLIRISVGALPLGELAKGQWRFLNADEVSLLVDKN
jgi:23S rRNA pseudouridine2605 synthase